MGILTLNETLNRDHVMNLMSEGFFQALQTTTPQDILNANTPTTAYHYKQSMS